MAAARRASTVTAQKRTASSPFQALAAASQPLTGTRHSRAASRRMRGPRGAAAVIWPLQEIGNRAFEPQRVGIDETPAAPDAPAILEETARHPLRSRPTPEHDGFEQGQARIFVHANIQPPGEPRRIKKNRFLRQPVETGLCAQGEIDGELGQRSIRAVDLFGGGRRHRDRRASPSLDADIEAVPAGDTAAGVDQNGIEPRALSPWEPDAHGTAFLDAHGPGASVQGHGLEGNTTDGSLTLRGFEF